MLNKILSIHAKWLKDNGYEYKQCLKEAKTFKQQTDTRQTEGFSNRRRYFNVQTKNLWSRCRKKLAFKI